MINSGERGFGLPKFSSAERDRRWRRVRELMQREKLDAIIGFPNQSHWDQFQADIRYLTHIGGHQTACVGLECRKVRVPIPREQARLDGVAGREHDASKAPPNDMGVRHDQPPGGPDYS